MQTLHQHTLSCRKQARTTLRLCTNESIVKTWPMSANLVRSAKRKKCANKVPTSETQVLRNKPALRYFHIFSNNSRAWFADEKFQNSFWQYYHLCTPVEYSSPEPTASDCVLKRCECSKSSYAPEASQKSLSLTTCKIFKKRLKIWYLVYLLKKGGHCTIRGRRWSHADTRHSDFGLELRKIRVPKRKLRELLLWETRWRRTGEKNWKAAVTGNDQVLTSRQAMPTVDKTRKQNVCKRLRRPNSVPSSGARIRCYSGHALVHKFGCKPGTLPNLEFQFFISKTQSGWRVSECRLRSHFLQQ